MEAVAVVITALTLDDRSGSPVTLHRTTTRRLTSASGLLGAGPLRNVTRSRPQAHGAIDDTRYQDGQPISLEGIVVGTSDAAVISDFHTISGAAFATLDVGGSLLKWTEASGLALQRVVKLAGPLDPPIAPSPRRLAYQVQFLAADPRAYSQTLGSVGASGTANVSVTNNGNRPTPPTFRIWGSAVHPRIFNVTDSTYYSLLGTIPASNYVELDTYNRTVKYNGTTGTASMLIAGSTTWEDVNPGTTTFHLVAGGTAGGTITAGARLDVFYRDAWV